MFCDAYRFGCVAVWVSVSVGPSDSGGSPWVFCRVVVWARSWSFRRLTPSARGVLIRGRIDFTALLSPSCQQTFGGVGPRTSIVDWCLRLPLGRMRRQLFHDRVEVEAAWGDAPNCCNAFAFGDSLVTDGWLLFSGHGFLEDFVKKSLVEEKSEYKDLDLNESTSLWW